MQRNLIRFFIPLVLYIFSYPVLAQVRSQQNWWMGPVPYGIQFSQPNDSALLVSRPGIGAYGNGGGVVVSDPFNGQLLFYSDGTNVYDATHTVMPNGTGVAGNNAGNQPAVAVRVPGSTTRYLLFTNSATPTAAGQIFVTEIDMSLTGNGTGFPAPPFGDVTATKAQPVAGLANESEAMIIIPNANGTDFWLITKEFGTNAFKVSPITATGITAAAALGTATPYFFNASHFDYYTYSSGAQLAVAPEDSRQNISLYNFDPATGSLTYSSSIFNSAVTTAVAPPAIYDVEYSPKGKFIYASHQNLLLQYNNADPSVAPDTITVPGMVKSFGLLAAPDSSIYHIYTNASGDFLIGKITNPEFGADTVIYETLPFGNIDFQASQFPQFLPKTQPVVTLDFTSSVACQNAATSFFPTVVPGADSLNWEFGDGAGTSNAWAPTYTYSTSGSMPVTVKAFVDGEEVATVTKSIDITAFDVQLSLTQDTTACSCELNFPKIPPPPDTYPDGTPCNPFQLKAQVQGSATFQWYGPAGILTGQTTETLTSVDSAGFYYLIATNGSGCQAYAGVNIKEYGVPDPRANIWHFGNQGGIDFNPDFRPATGADAIQGPLTSAEGVATISDRNGQVIFSTNGNQVWVRDGSTLPQTLGGNETATQSSLIIPVSGDPTKYYIFVTQEAHGQYELRYSIFDLKILPYGGLLPLDGGSTYSAVLYTKSTERLTGNPGWLISHEYGNNNFRAYPITGQGIGSPVISSIGSVHSFAYEEHAEGSMKLSPQSVLAVALSTPGVSNMVEIFDFIDSTGVVTNFRQVDLSQSTGQVYGLEFSPGGQKLYASTINPGSLHEFAYDSALGTYVKKTILNSGPGNIGAIETGPDGTVYVATPGAGSLGTITPNEDKDQNSTYNPTGFALTGGATSTLGLPNFIQSIGDALQTPTIVATGNCQGFPTLISGSGTDVIDTLTWYFGDGASQSGVNLTEVEHTYAAPGEYTITLEIANRCKGIVGTLTQKITIYGTPVVNATDVTLCDGGTDEQFNAVDPADPLLSTYTFLWNTGQTTNTISPPEEGIYTVSVTTAEGCNVPGIFTAQDNRPPVDLGADQIICQNSDPITFDAGNLGATFTWTQNNVVVANDPVTPQRFTFNPTGVGSYTIRVNVTDPLTSCTNSDTVIIRTNPQVNATITLPTTPTSNCGNDDGAFTFTVTSTGDYFYGITGPVSSTANVTGPSAPINVNNLSAGAYYLTINDQVTGCTFGRTVGISDGNANFTVDLQKAAACINSPTDRTLPVKIITDATTPFDYRIVGQNTGNVVSSNRITLPASPPEYSIGSIPTGFFFTEVTQAGGCIVVAGPTEIDQEDEVTLVSQDVSQCASPVTISLNAPGALGFNWYAGPNIDPATRNSSTMTATPGPGTYTYSVEIQGDGKFNCSNYEDFIVTVENTPLITQSNPCGNPVILTATPTGPDYVYVWSCTGCSTPPVGAETITLNAADNGVDYSVQIRNTTTGCTITSNTLTAQVIGAYTVDIEEPLACKGIDFTLTATTDPSQSGLNYRWFLDEKEISGQVSNSLTVTDDKEGVYKVELTNGGLCPVSDEVQINVAPVTAGTLLDKGVVCPNPPDTEPVTLDPGPDFISYQWYRNGNPLTGETNRTYEATDIGTYSVDLVNLYGCPSTDEILLEDLCDPKITGPNAFRPEGLNKEFSLFTFYIADEDFEIFIFNRWGEMVYYSNDRYFKWNGGYKNNAGQLVPPGTYTYLVKYKSSYRPQDGIEELRGGVVVLR